MQIGVERWLGGYEGTLLSKRTRVPFPSTHFRWLTTPCDPGSRGLYISGLHVHTCMCIYTNEKIIKI